MNNEIFVFGSNLMGIHGAGSALEAIKHGAINGLGSGRQGNSYAIPTKSSPTANGTLPISRIKLYIDQFIEYAKDNLHLTFNVVKIGCGLAGYTEDEIATLFRYAPKNVNLPTGWRK